MSIPTQHSSNCLLSHALAALPRDGSAGEVMDTACASIRERLDLDACRVDLIEDDGVTLRTIALSEEPSNLTRVETGASFLLEDVPLVAKVLRERNARFLDTERTAEQAGSIVPSEHCPPILGMCIAPIIDNQGMMGLLYGFNFTRQADYGEEFRSGFMTASRCAGTILRVCGLCHRTTESDKWYHRLVESSGDLVLTWTPEGTVTYASQVATDDWGVCSGMNLSELMGFVHEDDRQGTLDSLERSKSATDLMRFDNRILSPAGEELRVLWNVCAFRDQSGRLTHLQGVGREVTAWYELEQKLQSVQRSESIVRLVRGFAHKFNNMLVSVLGNATVLSDQLDENHDWHPIILDIIDGADRAAKLTKQLLAYGRSTSHMPQRHRLRDLLAEYFELNETVLPSIVNLEVHIDAENDWVHADAMQLQQVVISLVLNAAEAMPEGGTVVVRTSRTNQGTPDAGWVVLSVEDTGIGIPPEDRQKVFDPFFSTKDMGRGLGLAAVQGIVQAHQGRIEIGGEPGQGTIVRVLLPSVENT